MKIIMVINVSKRILQIYYAEPWAVSGFQPPFFFTLSIPSVTTLLILLFLIVAFWTLRTVQQLFALRSSLSPLITLVLPYTFGRTSSELWSALLCTLNFHVWFQPLQASVSKFQSGISRRLILGNTHLDFSP